MTKQEHEKFAKEFEDAYRDLFNHTQQDQDNSIEDIFKICWFNEYLACKWEKITGLTTAQHFEEFDKWCQVIE